MIRRLDLNADLGEGMGNDEDLLAIVTSASIACGGHAGDPDTMRIALRSARAHNVRAGAHPGFEDREHFGRRRLSLTPDMIAVQVLRQIDTLSTIAAQESVPLAYFKLHGALANMTAEDDGLADFVFAVIYTEFPSLSVLVLENSAQQRAAERLGMQTITEAYADRAYTAAGLLVPRAVAGAVIHEDEQVIDRCLRLAMHGELVAIDGSVLISSAQSVCLHGDTPGAVNLAREIRARLQAAGALMRQ